LVEDRGKGVHIHFHNGYCSSTTFYKKSLYNIYPYKLEIRKEKY
jgi:hypothetical protein